MTRQPSRTVEPTGSTPPWDETRAIELVALLVSSADTSLSEPRKYPPYRLLDAAGFVAAWATSQPGHGRVWGDLEQLIAEHKDLMLWDKEQFEDVVRSLSAWLVHRLMPSDAEPESRPGTNERTVASASRGHERTDDGSGRVEQREPVTTPQDPVYGTIRARRVTRTFTPDEVTEAQLRRLVLAARWAPTAGNTRLHRFVVVTDSAAITRVRLVSPGIEADCPALIVTCLDLEVCRTEGVLVERDPSPLIDTGTSAMSMMLSAHELGLGSCPTTSFSAQGVSAALSLDARLRPQLLLQVGHPRPTRPGQHPKRRIGVDDISEWIRSPQP